MGAHIPLESMIGMMDFQAARWTVAKDNPPQVGNDHPTLVPMGTYATSDGHINLAASGGRLWEEFCKELGAEEWITDSRFSDSLGRKRNKDELVRLIEQRLVMDTTESWVARLNLVGVPCGPVHTVAETFADPQVMHLEMAKPIHHRNMGEIKILRNATNISGVSNDIRSPSPLKGEHSLGILEEFGFDEDEVADLTKSGVVEVNPELGR